MYRILAGTPATTALSGMSWVTTAIVPTCTLLPMLTLFITFTPGLSVTLSPIVIL